MEAAIRAKKETSWKVFMVIALLMALLLWWAWQPLGHGGVESSRASATFFSICRDLFA